MNPDGFHSLRRSGIISYSQKLLDNSAKKLQCDLLLKFEASLIKFESHNKF